MPKHTVSLFALFVACSPSERAADPQAIPSQEPPPQETPALTELELVTTNMKVAMSDGETEAQRGLTVRSKAAELTKLDTRGPCEAVPLPKSRNIDAIATVVCDDTMSRTEVWFTNEGSDGLIHSQRYTLDPDASGDEVKPETHYKPTGEVQVTRVPRTPFAKGLVLTVRVVQGGWTDKG